MYYVHFYNFLLRKWYFDRLYNQIIVQNILHVGYNFSYQDIDRGMLEEFGPKHVVIFIQNCFKILRTFYSGSLFHYLSFLLLSTVLIILIEINVGLTSILLFFIS